MAVRFHHVASADSDVCRFACFFLPSLVSSDSIPRYVVPNSGAHTPAGNQMDSASRDDQHYADGWGKICRSGGSASDRAEDEAWRSEPTATIRNTPEPGRELRCPGANLPGTQSVFGSGWLKTQALAQQTDLFRHVRFLPHRPEYVQNCSMGLNRRYTTPNILFNFAALMYKDGSIHVSTGGSIPVSAIENEPISSRWHGLIRVARHPRPFPGVRVLP